MTFKEPMASDSGDYKCVAKNIMGESEAQLTLNLTNQNLYESKPSNGLAPNFVGKPEIVTADDGKSMAFICKIKAIPECQVEWFYNDTPITKISQYKRISTKSVKSKEDDTYEYQLHLNSPEPKDSGIYKCHAKNGYGESNGNLSLQIDDEMEDTEENKENIINRRKSAFRCNIEKPVIKFESGGKNMTIEFKVNTNSEDKNPRLEWFKDDKILKMPRSPTGNRMYVTDKRLSNVETVYVLHLNNLDISDQGTYKLIMHTKDGGSHSSEVILHLNKEDDSTMEIENRRKSSIMKVLKFLSALKDQVAQVGGNAKFTFTMQDSRRFKITWFKDDKELDKTDLKYQIYSETNSENETVDTLELLDIKAKDAGKYKVIVNDGKQAITQTATLTVLKGPNAGKVHSFGH
ncbi:unnamed protein product [Gordionus sp. m RMFG-2023]